MQVVRYTCMGCEGVVVDAASIMWGCFVGE